MHSAFIHTPFVSKFSVGSCIKLCNIAFYIMSTFYISKKQDCGFATHMQIKISLTLVRYDSVVAPDVYFCHVYTTQTELTLTTMSSKHLLLSSQKKNNVMSRVLRPLKYLARVILYKILMCNIKNIRRQIWFRSSTPS